MISETTITAVRDRTDIAALIGESIKLVRRGRSHLGLCPFHKEKSPSFSVNAERGVFYCFGCKEHGDAIGFVMKQEGRSFQEAVRELAERAGIEVEDNATDADRREAAAARRSTEDLYAVNALAATFYEHSLRGGPGMRPHALAVAAVDELARRGLPLEGPPEVDAALRAFRIGYAPNAWDGLVAYLQRQGVSPVVAERAGLIVPRSSGGGHYDRFRHRLMFAVIDVAGRVIAFSGRALPSPEDGEEKPAKYINSPESPIYTKGEHLFGLYQARQAIRQSGEAVLVEGNFDVVALHARGVGNVVAPLGTAFTEHQARLLRRFTPSVTLMLDGDTAGKKATWAARVPCRAAGISARSAAVPKGLDPDEIAQRGGPEAVRTLLAAAPPLAHRLLDLLLRDGELDGAPIADQAERVRSAVRLLAEAGDEIERAMLRSYADQIAQAFGVGRIEELESMLRRPRGTERSREERAPFAEEMSLAMLGALVDFPALLDDAAAQERLSQMSGPAALAVPALRAGAAEAVIASTPDELRPFVARRLASPLFETPQEALKMLCHYAKKIAAHRRQHGTTEAA